MNCARVAARDGEADRLVEIGGRDRFAALIGSHDPDVGNANAVSSIPARIDQQTSSRRKPGSKNIIAGSQAIRSPLGCAKDVYLGQAFAGMTRKIGRAHV